MSNEVVELKARMFDMSERLNDASHKLDQSLILLRGIAVKLGLTVHLDQNNKPVIVPKEILDRLDELFPDQVEEA